MGGGKAPAKKDAAGPGEKLKAAVAAYEIGSDEDLVQMGETLANSLAEALVSAAAPCWDCAGQEGSRHRVQRGGDGSLPRLGVLRLVLTNSRSRLGAQSGTEVRDLMTHILTFLKEGSALDADALKEVQSKCNVRAPSCRSCGAEAVPDSRGAVIVCVCACVPVGGWVCLQVLRNEVLKDQRAADKKKKSKKKAVKTMRNDDWMEGAGRYEDFGDDYGDFM